MIDDGLSWAVSPAQWPARLHATCDSYCEIVQCSSIVKYCTVVSPAQHLPWPCDMLYMLCCTVLCSAVLCWLPGCLLACLLCCCHRRPRGNDSTKHYATCCANFIHSGYATIASLYSKQSQRSRSSLYSHPAAARNQRDIVVFVSD